MTRLPAFVLIIALVATMARADQFGWQPVPEAVAALAAQTTPLYGAQVASLAASTDDRDALIYRFLAAELGVPRLVAINQLDAGTCVGCGTCQATGVSLSVQIHTRRDGPRAKWVAPFSVEAVYAMGREHAGKLGPWDGSSGAWSCAAIRDWGTCVMEQVGSTDLRTYDPRRAQHWARSGVPGAIRAAAKPRRVLACTLVRTTAEAQGLLQNGYGMFTCSKESYFAQRDALGFALNDGRNAWPHCMAIVAYRGASSGRAGFCMLNSWGDWCTGPMWPADQPIGSFWITESDLRQHLAAGDTWAVGDVTGFQGHALTIPRAIDVGGPMGLDLSRIVRPGSRTPSLRSDNHDPLLALCP